MRGRRIRLGSWCCIVAALITGEACAAGDEPKGEQRSKAELNGQVTTRQADRIGGKPRAAASSRQEETAASFRRGEPGFSKTELGWPLLKNIALDQKAIWTSPTQFRLGDANWLVPLGGLTAGLLATDRDTSRHLSNSPNRLKRSRNLSDFGAASLVGAAGGLYLWGKITHDDHRRETGLLAGEALLNGLAVNTAIQFATGRERPSQDFGRGRFGQNGRSFPSDHAMAAWSVASVIAHEYPDPLTKVLAYGLASAVSASRVTGKEHFPSDVLVGSAIGWFIGQRVYRAHHDPELGGGSWETFLGLGDGESRRQPKNMGSPYVSLDSWVYAAFDRLAALGYLHSDFEGMRPWTRLECARLVGEAGDRLREQESDSPEPNRLYRALEKEFAEDVNLLGGPSNRSLHLESVYTRFAGISGKPLRDGYHFGQTIINDYGRPYAEGTNVVTGFSAWATDGPFTVYVRGEYQHAPSAPALSDPVRNVIAAADNLPLPPATPFPSVNRFRLLDTYVAMNVENWQVSFGKQSLWWGPGQGGPMMFSDNAEPVLMLRINRVSPFKLPSILGWMGPIRTEFFFGQLVGHEFIFSNPSGLIGESGRALDRQPFFEGVKLSFKPTPNFEFSVSQTSIFAGADVPLTLHTFIRTFSIHKPETGAPGDPGDRRTGIDLTYRLPRLRKWLTFYMDAFSEDQISPLAYWDKSAIHAGIYIPRLPRVPKLDFRAEGGYTDLPIDNFGGGVFYYDNRNRNGYTNLGNLMGNWIGRQGKGAQVWSTYWLSPRNTIQFSYRHQKVSQEFIPRGGTLSDLKVRADFWVRPNVSISSSVQYEKWTFPVLSPGAQSNATTSFQLTFWPGHGGQ